MRSTLLVLLPFFYLTTVIAGTTILDDSNAAWTFSGTWHTVTATAPCKGCHALPDINLAHGKTYHDGVTAGKSAGGIRFKGTGITVYGIDAAPKEQGAVQFRLNNDPVKVYENKKTAAYGYNTVYFEASGLPLQEHVLTFTVIQSSWKGKSALLDYAVVTDDLPTSAVVPPPSAQQTTSTVEGPVQSDAAISSEETAPADPSGGSSVSQGVIIGAATAGGVAVLILLLALCLCIRKKKRSQATLADMEYNGAGNLRHMSFIPSHRVGDGASTRPASLVYLSGGNSNWSSAPPSESGYSASENGSPSSAMYDGQATVQRAPSNGNDIYANIPPPPPLPSQAPVLAAHGPPLTEKQQLALAYEQHDFTAGTSYSSAGPSYPAQAAGSGSQVHMQAPVENRIATLEAQIKEMQASSNQVAPEPAPPAYF
ncbi:hypothetical protein DL96DRAFT_1625373 [Flagelloscypha sp. PMI_526]|nr:hypothetical protein DL96DRAFT_1625373 [Flagelloscypha sp. PMI_526]